MKKIRDRICENPEGLRYVLAWYTKSMAIILLADARMRLLMEVPNVTIDGERISGEAVEDPDFSDYIRVFNGDDILRATGQTVQLMAFLDYLLEQEEPEDGRWFETEQLGEMWNAYAKEQTNG